MEHRPYFVVGDVLVSLVVGMLAALGTSALVSRGWIMWLGMLAGLTVGAIVAGVVGGLVFRALFGALEIVIPAMLTGMLTGMVLGTLSCVSAVPPGDAALLGAGCGFLCLAFVYGMNAYLTREGHSWTT